jgi:hypothetical protein
MNGRGTYRYRNGIRVYHEECNYDEMTGKVIIKYANGDFYDGEWKYGCRNGKGTMKYANGDVYDGKWMYN